MHILMLTPGTGSFYCGSCLRDQSLAGALREIGHEVTVAPLYLPPFLEQNAADAPVQMGGINLWLQQKTRLWRRLPRWFRGLLDRPALLRAASRRGGMTGGTELSAMTLSMLQGEQGRQAESLEQLVAAITTLPPPDVLVLSNVMLSGLVRRLKATLGRPVVVTLQGELPFLDSLAPDFAARAWAELRTRAADVDAFVAVSRHYGEVMRERLALDPQRLHVVPNGIDLADLPTAPAPLAARRPRTVGYLARMCPDKGLDTLVDAFVSIKAGGAVDDLRLHVAGVVLPEDRAFVAAQQSRLRAHGLAGDAVFSADVTRAEKLALLGSLSALSVPARYEESFGLYVLEALAAGVPVVQPRHAAFPELIEATGGGLLCAPGAAALAEGLEALLRDEPRAQELADRGRRAVRERFGADRMARDVAAVCAAVTRSPARNRP